MNKWLKFLFTPITLNWAGAAAAAISAGGSMVQANRQQDANEAALERQEELEKEAREREEKILLQSAQDDARDNAIVFGADREFTGDAGSFSDFLTPTTGSGMKQTTLGSSLGFGV